MMHHHVPLSGVEAGLESLSFMYYMCAQASSENAIDIALIMVLYSFLYHC